MAFTFLYGWEKKRWIIYHTKRKWYKIQISVFIKLSSNLATPILIYVYVVYGWLHATTAELKSFKRPYGPQHQKYLLSDPLHKKFVDSCCYLTTPNIGQAPAASTSPGSLLETQTLWLLLRPNEAESADLKDPQMILSTVSFVKHCSSTPCAVLKLFVDILTDEKMETWLGY